MEPFGVLFDMDGVLVLSNPAHLAAWQLYGQSLGLEITREMFFRAISGRKNEEALEALFPGRFALEERSRMAEEKETLYRQQSGPHLQSVPGVLEMIRGFADAPPSIVNTALATSGPPENAGFVIDRFGLQDAFQAVVTAADVEKAKPDPTIYLLAAERLGLAPKRCVVLEDAYAGIRAAKRAGMTCLAVTTSESASRLREAGADQVRQDFVGLSWRTIAELL